MSVLHPPLAGLAIFVAAAGLLSAAPAAFAERADRTQPLTVEADKSSTVDLARQTVVFLGNVVITQGTMRIEAERVEVRESSEGWRSALATGTASRPASFRQKRDGVDETVEGRAERIEYDGRADTVRLSGNATMRRLRAGAPADEVKGQVITYDAVNELFTVTGGGEPGGRVRAVLTPQPPASAPSPGQRRP